MRSEPCRPTCVNEFHVPLQVPVNHEHLVAARMRTGPLPNFFVMLFDVFLGRKDRVLTARLKAEIEADFFSAQEKKTTPKKRDPQPGSLAHRHRFAVKNQPCIQIHRWQRGLNSTQPSSFQGLLPSQWQASRTGGAR